SEARWFACYSPLGGRAPSFSPPARGLSSSRRPATISMLLVPPPEPSMSRVWLSVAFAVALACLAAAQEKKEPPKEGKKDEQKLTKEEQEVIDLTNAERKKADLKPLSPNARLMAAARGHAENMARQEKLEHTLDDKTLADRAKDAGYSYGW